MADIDSQLSALSEGELFTTLDLSNGYLQIPLSEESKDKTAFITPDTTAKFEQMPFGIRNGPVEFKKMMDRVLHELLKNGSVHCYLNVVILSCKNSEQVLTELQKANLTLKPSKCVFMAKELNYLGFRIAKGQLKPGDKVEAINLEMYISFAIRHFCSKNVFVFTSFLVPTKILKRQKFFHEFM